jgi:chloramphenicol-sensitive protein RarD
LGVLLLKERLRTAQWLAVGIATIGVAYLSIGYGSLPWIALVLAFSFGFYGLLKKKHDLASMESLTGEMAVLVVPAVIFLATLLWTGESGFGNSSSRINILLVFSGAVTAIPLLFFAAAAQRIPLSMLGLLQYIAPTLQFLIGVYIYSEPFDTTRLIGFVIIWIALAVYMIDNIVRWRNGNRIGEGLIDRI